MAIVIRKFSKNFRGSMPPNPPRAVLFLSLLQINSAEKKNTLNIMSKFDVPSLKKFRLGPWPETWSKCLITSFSRAKRLTPLCVVNKTKSNLHYTDGIKQKCVTSDGGGLFHGIAPWWHRNLAVVASRWRQCLIWPARESNPRSSAPTRMFLTTTTSTGRSYSVRIQLNSRLHPPSNISWIRCYLSVLIIGIDVTDNVPTFTD